MTSFDFRSSDEKLLLAKYVASFIFKAVDHESQKKTNREKLNGMENKGKNEEERKTKKTTKKFFCILCQSKMEKGYT